MNVSMMLTVYLNYFLLLLTFIASVCSFPPTPLNERNQEISWEAWLLVDDQNQQQNRQAHDDKIPRRRITPKSVFVAPTFSPENLPPCAEGYSSDPMGRCVKIIKLDEDRHLDFLVSKLNEKFGSSLDYDTMLEFDDAESEPTRLDIPLSPDDNYPDDYSSDTPQGELDMAIIVTPTTRDKDSKSKDDNSKLGKRDDTVTENLFEQELKKLLTTSTTTRKYEDITLRDQAEQSTFAEAEASISTTTIRNSDREDTTLVTVQTVEDVETTTLKSIVETTIGNIEEDFFTAQEVDTTTSTDPTTTEENTTEFLSTPAIKEITTISATTPKITTTTPKITTYHPVATTYHPYLDLSLWTNSKTKNLVKFPDEELSVGRSHPDGGFIRFPDIDGKYQQESLSHHTRDVDDQNGNFFNEIVTPQPSQRIQEIVLPPRGVKGYFSGYNHNYNKHPAGYYSKFFPSKDTPEIYEKPYASQSLHLVNHATTEKHPVKKHGLFKIPSKWSTEEHHKPIVLRFSRKHFNVDTNKFKNSEFYRSLPMDDLTYLFGHKNGQSAHR